MNTTSSSAVQETQQRELSNKRAMNTIIKEITTRLTDDVHAFTIKGGAIINIPTEAERAEVINQLLHNYSELCYGEKTVIERSIYAKLGFAIGKAIGAPGGFVEGLAFKCSFTRPIMEGVYAGRSTGGRGAEASVDAITSKLSGASLSVKDALATAKNKAESILSPNNIDVAEGSPSLAKTNLC